MTACGAPKSTIPNHGLDDVTFNDPAPVRFITVSLVNVALYHELIPSGERERRDALRGDQTTDELAERVVELTSERDRLWAQIVRLQQRIAQLENALVGHPTIDTPIPSSSAATGPQSGLSRAERRRLEREQQRRRRNT